MNFTLRKTDPDEPKAPPDNDAAPEAQPEPLRTTVVGAPVCAGKPDGSSCGGFALVGRERCFWHDPDAQAAREHPSGRAPYRRAVAGPPVLANRPSLKTPADVLAFLEELADYLATHPDGDPRRVTALNSVANSLLRAIEAADLDRELAAARKRNVELEQQVAALLREDDDRAACVSSMEATIADLNRRCAAYSRELKYVGIDPSLIGRDSS